MSGTYDIGDAVVLYAVFRDEAGDQADPTAVTLLVRDPSGNTAEESNAAAQAGDETAAETATGQTLSGVTGVYKATVTVDEAGWWHYKWVGSGNVAEMEASWIEVRRDRVGAAS